MFQHEKALVKDLGSSRLRFGVGCVKFSSLMLAKLGQRNGIDISGCFIRPTGMIYRFLAGFYPDLMGHMAYIVPYSMDL